MEDLTFLSLSPISTESAIQLGGSISVRGVRTPVEGLVVAAVEPVWQTNRRSVLVFFGYCTRKIAYTNSESTSQGATVGTTLYAAWAVKPVSWLLPPRMWVDCCSVEAVALRHVPKEEHTVDSTTSHRLKMPTKKSPRASCDFKCCWQLILRDGRKARSK